MVTMHRAAADIHVRHIHALNAQQIKPVTGADDVTDGVDGADFVEMHALQLDAMDAGFGLSQGEEDFLRAFLRPGGQAGIVDNLVDVVQVPVFVVGGRFDNKTGAGDAGAFGLFHGKGGSGP